MPNRTPTTADLPRARCVGRAELFSPSEDREHGDGRDERQALAVAECRRCEALAACRAWLDSLPPHEKPVGVVAGVLINRDC